MATRYEVNPRMLSPAALAKQTTAVESHRVATISYPDDVMTCTCGEWEGPALDLKPFKAHRKEAGMKAR